MSELDPNAWYRLSETRVDNSTGPFAFNLQLRDLGLGVYSSRAGEAAWQFQPVGDVKGRYFMRLDQEGAKQQLAVCYHANEPASGKTVACLQKPSTDKSQQWDVSDFGSGTFKFLNVANGTKYVLDAHPTSNLFMNSAIEGSPGVADNQPAQHWVLSSVSAVNDRTYATIHPGDLPVSTHPAMFAAPASATSSSTLAAASKPRGISVAAGAGIGVAVALGSVSLIGAVAFWWWRRQKRPAKPKYSEVEAKNGDSIGKGSSRGGSAAAGSSPSSLHGVSPTVGVSNLSSSWQHASSIGVTPAESFVYGQQTSHYYNNGHTQASSAGAQHAGYCVGGQQPSPFAGTPLLGPHGGHQTASVVGGQPSVSPFAGQQRVATNSGVAAAAALPRHQFDHPAAHNEFAPAAPTVSSGPNSLTGFDRGAVQSQTSSTVNLSDFELIPQAHELEVAERNIVRRQHELGTFHHGPDTFMNEQANRMAEPPQAELGAYHHGPDTFAQSHEEKMLGVPKAELGAYQHGPDTFENEHEDKVLGTFRPEKGGFSREREDKVLGTLQSLMNSAGPSGRSRQTDASGSQTYEMDSFQPPMR